MKALVLAILSHGTKMSRCGHEHAELHEEYFGDKSDVLTANLRRGRCTVLTPNLSVGTGFGGHARCNALTPNQSYGDRLSRKCMFERMSIC